MPKIPPPKYESWRHYLLGILPGFLFCLLFGSFAILLDANLLGEETFILNYVIIAILLGLFINNIFTIPEYFRDGIDFSTKICLYIGIVLLGTGINISKIFTIGSVALLMVAISITFCITFCGLLAKKMGIEERWGHLVGTGMGVCGISAIIATAPVIKAKEREIITAISITIFADIIVLITLSPIGHALGWSHTLAGFIAGIVPANTAQCIAIGHAYSEIAGEVATIIKSARNGLMPLVILSISYIYTRKGLSVGEKVRLKLLWNKFPKFIFGFLIAAALSTMGFIPAESIALTKSLASWFFVICFVGLGAGINLKGFKRSDIIVLGLALLTTSLLWLYVYCVFTLIY